MIKSYWRGYADGEAYGRAATAKEFERVLAVLREELADRRSYGEAQAHRADAACDLLLGHLGARAISMEGEVREVERAERHIKSVQQLTQMPDPTEELPYGHPSGRYASERDARIDVEDAAVMQMVTE